MNAVMKSSPTPRWRALRAFLILSAAAASVVNSGAQDAVTLKSGVVREGTVTGVSGGTVQLRMGSGSTGIRLADIAEVRMAAPPEFQAAVNALQQGRARVAAEMLRKINATYAGLPAPWVERSSALLGDALLAAGDTAGAEQAYQAFQKAYPQARDLANLGMARLAVEKGQMDEAQRLLKPLLDTAAKTTTADEEEGARLSQVYYLQGRLLEASNRQPEALEAYLTAVTIFPQDAAVASLARARADALRKDSGTIVP